METSQPFRERYWTPLVEGLLDLIYPPCCQVCREWLEEGVICAACLQGFDPLSPPYCDRCGLPVEVGRLVCSDCETTAPPYAWSQVLGQYKGTLRTAIHRLKYHRRAALALPLGQLLAHSLDNPPSPLLPPNQPHFDRVVPVPLHPRRLRWRGFNQAERLARVLAIERGWTLDTQGVRRIRATRTQTRLTATQRASNVRGAFAVRSPDYFQGCSVLLVDDVFTTMATVREVARVVRDAGAIRIGAVALARGE